MFLLHAFIEHFLIPLAHADVSDLGAGAPGVSGMWAMLKSTFPHTELGAAAPIFFMGRVAQFVLSLIGGTAICSIVYAGIKVSTAGGDSGKLSEAKTIIMYSLAGVVFAILADSIVLYICSVMIPLIAGGGAGGCPLW
jgi:hypothetical protein